MRVTKRKLACLAVLLVLCLAAMAILNRPDTHETQTDEELSYLFANYPDSSAILGISIENPTGEVMVACVDKAYYVSSDYGLAPDGTAIQALLDTACYLPLNSLLEGASAADSQFGLAEPQGVVVVQDINQGGCLFNIGAQTPDKQAYYVCLGGDDRVFLMDAALAEVFLADVQQYYDLSLFPDLSDTGMEHLTSITVQRDGGTAYALQKLAYSAEADLAQFTLDQPIRLLLSSDWCSSEVLTPLRSLSGVQYIPDPDLAACGLTETAPRLTLTYDDGQSATLRIGREDGVNTYILSENTQMVVLVPTASVNFIHDSVQTLVGKKLVTLNLNAVTSITLNGVRFEMTGSGSDLAVSRDGAPVDLPAFRSGIFSALNNISIQGTYDGAVSAAPLLSADVQTSIAQERIRLDFYDLNDRQCAIAVNGKTAFWCNRVAVDGILSVLQ